jgi:hypothetical protein
MATEFTETMRTPPLRALAQRPNVTDDFTMRKSQSREARYIIFPCVTESNEEIGEAWGKLKVVRPDELFPSGPVLAVESEIKHGYLIPVAGDLLGLFAN